MKFKVIGAIIWIIFFALILTSIMRTEAAPHVHHTAKVQHSIPR
jgi:hypothetical protein